MVARNLIILILDSLRADFENLCSQDHVETSNLAQLARYAPLRPRARCGSFPTGPMRTDLLTGSLAFLRGEWALPRPGEETLVSRCRESGYRTCLVTDNYVTVIPRVGGLFIDLFDSVDFIRGAAADPWTTPDAELLRSCLEREWSFPTRSAVFEAQFRANAARLRRTGKSHIEQLFQSATEQLESLKGHDRFVLWVDSFACHEPWVTFEDTSQPPPPAETPFFPGYVSSTHFLPEHLSMLRAQYVRRIGETSASMKDFVSAVGSALRTGDTALVVLSDHGFLFGEFGFVGKPAETPLPPQLHEVVCWLSNHFEDQLPMGSLGLQPHLLHSSILSTLGLADRDPSELDVHIFGRNSPRSDFLAAADREGLTILRKTNGKPTLITFLPWKQLDESIPLVAHSSEPPSASTVKALRSLIRKGQSDWLDSFC
jgi:arylsulfatase A-like enzyme